jgi:hypothetical protein
MTKKELDRLVSAGIISPANRNRARWELQTQGDPRLLVAEGIVARRDFLLASLHRRGFTGALSRTSNQSG